MTAEPLTDADFRALFREAKTPDPTAVPDDLLGLYFRLMQPNRYPTTRRLKGPVSESLEVRQAMKQSNAAIEVLLKQLPVIEKWAPGEELIGADIRNQAKHLRLQIQAFEPFNQVKNNQPYVWHEAARTFLLVYQKTTGDQGLSPGGPSSRFVQAALRRLGYGQQNLGAIEKALRRTGTATNA